MNITAARRIKAQVTGLYGANGKDFLTLPVSELVLGFDGIQGDFHAGVTRKSGGREPWYPRGTEMRNERQVSILAADELQAIADEMGLNEIKPEWMGGNMLLDGVSNLSMLPPRTLMFFEGGVTLKVDGQNAPCRLSGRSIATHAGRSDVDDVALAFKEPAKRRRGLVVWVEKPGIIKQGETCKLHLPEQWIYSS